MGGKGNGLHVFCGGEKQFPCHSYNGEAVGFVRKTMLGVRESITIDVLDERFVKRATVGVYVMREAGLSCETLS